MHLMKVTEVGSNQPLNMQLRLTEYRTEIVPLSPSIDLSRGIFQDALGEAEGLVFHALGLSLAEN